MSNTYELKYLADELKEWAMYCVLETFLKMNKELTLSGFTEEETLLWEIGGLDGLMDEVLHWAKYRLGTDYGQRGIQVKKMTWIRKEGSVVCNFDYEGGEPLSNTDIMDDEDFKQYASLCYQALSPRSIRSWTKRVLARRLKYRYEDACLEECVDRYYQAQADENKADEND